MIPGKNVGSTLEEYQINETQLHRELMNSCRKYINQLSIVSILGILDIVKQEAIDLEKATKYVPTQEYDEEHNEVHNAENESN